jgi:hypothetical protein
MRRSWVRLALFGGIAIASSLVHPEVVDACQICVRSNWLTPWNRLCRPVEDRESGTTTCETKIEPASGLIYCHEGGDFCAVIDVFGGGGTGGGGTGGGGTNPCQTTGFCPAECFSCSGGGSGGGTLPAV